MGKAPRQTRFPEHSDYSWTSHLDPKIQEFGRVIEKLLISWLYYLKKWNDT
jgi:hypothetical protein